MARTRLIAALILTYIAFAMLLNSVGTVILQSISSFGVSKPEASTLEGFKDITIAVVSFATASYLPRFGLRNALIASLVLAIAACIVMPLFGSFGAAQLHFALVGAAFAVAKVVVYSMIGLVTDNPRQHASLTSLIEGMFMVGVLSSYWVFSAFIDPTGLRWLNAYWVLAGVTALALALILVSPVDERRAAADERAAAEGPAFVAMLKLAALPLVLVFVVCAFLFVLIEQGIQSWLPTFNNEVLHLSAQMSVQAASLFAACLAIGRFAAGAVMARFDWYPVLNVCLAVLAALIILVLPLADSLNPRHDRGMARRPRRRLPVPADRHCAGTHLSDDHLGHAQRDAQSRAPAADGPRRRLFGAGRDDRIGDYRRVVRAPRRPHRLYPDAGADRIACNGPVPAPAPDRTSVGAGASLRSVGAGLSAGARQPSNQLRTFFDTSLAGQRV